jgi:hypothetical protein
MVLYGDEINTEAVQLAQCDLVLKTRLPTEMAPAE